MKNSKKLFLLFFIASCSGSCTMRAMSWLFKPKSNTIEDLIKKGDLATLAALKEEGKFDVNQDVPAVDPETNKVRLYPPLKLAAIEYPNPPIVHFLLENGADIDKVPQILQQAMIRPLHDYEKKPVPPAIVGLLLNHGAKRDFAEKTLKFYAEDIGRKRRNKYPHLDPEKQALTFVGSCGLLWVHGYHAVPEVKQVFLPAELPGIQQRHKWAVEKEKARRTSAILEGVPILPAALAPIVYDYQKDETMSYFNEQEYLAEHPEQDQNLTAHDHRSRNCVIS